MLSAIKTAWKSTSVKIWAFASAALIIVLITALIIAIAHPLVYGTMNSMFGGEMRELVEGDPTQYVYYKGDYNSKSEVYKAANKLNERIMEEGIILLKNEDETLPLADEKNITVFGRSSGDLVLGGSGSSVGTGSTDKAVTLYESLQSAGYTYNPAMKSFYDNCGIKRADVPSMGTILTGFPIAEVPRSSYTSVRDSYAGFKDAALVVISRMGGEGFDLPRTMFWNGKDYRTWSGSDKIPGARSKDDHYLQLDQNETDMLKEACDNFDKVVLIINSSTSMELGFLDDPGHYAFNQKIKAALWIGNPGISGINALGRVLKGDVTPSGKTVDLFARDFKTDPTWNNFGNNLTDSGNRYTTTANNKVTQRNAYYVEYEEGIYIGYRYWETRAFTEGLNVPYSSSKINGTTTTDDWDDWYDAHVVYPFGHGLSYTTFDWDVASVKHPDGAELSGGDEIEIEIKVTNTGEDYAGKEVVQLYYTPQYKSGGIEKAHVVLAAFGKTGVIEPGESETVKLAFNVRDMASYDYSDANGNGFKGYELDDGDYEIKIMRDSHTPEYSVTYTLPAVRYETDSKTDTKVKNLFGDVSEHIKKYMSRSKFEETWPTVPTAAERNVTEDFIASLSYTLNDKATDPWYAENMPVQSAFPKGQRETIKLYELKDTPYDDLEAWDEFLNQLTVNQMRTLVNTGNFRTAMVESVDKPLTIDADGPMGFAIFMGDPSVYETCYYASECILGASWNIVLAEEMGKMVGNEGLIGYANGDGRPYSGWYAPAVNIHRSQFGGRNFEYYSEDAKLNGKMAAAVIRGAKSKGVYTYVKHFALNDQETNRETNGLVTWANEQSMREIYLLPFELAVKEGGTTAMMTSFNRIGKVWAGGDYRLLTELLRKEWGFRGMVVTDFNVNNHMHINQMIRAGGDLSLSADKKWDFDGSATSVAVTRNAVKNIMYTVAKSNAMNGYGDGVIYRYTTPVWLILAISGCAAVFVICCAWGAFVIILAVKKSKNNNVL